MAWKSIGPAAASLVLYGFLAVCCVWAFNYYWEEAYPWEAVTVEKALSKREFILSDGRRFFWTYPKEVVRPHDRSVVFLNKFLEKLASMASAARSEDPGVTIPPFNAVIPSTHRTTADIYSNEIYFLVLYPEQLSLSDDKKIGLMNVRLGYGEVSFGSTYAYKLQDILAANGIQVIPDSP